MDGLLGTAIWHMALFLMVLRWLSLKGWEPVFMTCTNDHAFDSILCVRLLFVESLLSKQSFWWFHILCPDAQLSRCRSLLGNSGQVQCQYLLHCSYSNSITHAFRRSGVFSLASLSCVLELIFTRLGTSYFYGVKQFFCQGGYHPQETWWNFYRRDNSAQVEDIYRLLSWS